MTPAPALLKRIYDCPPGLPGWSEFEDACVAVLEYLFVPPLRKAKRQPRTYSGISRRDAVFPNRDNESNGAWKQLLTELGARLVLVEFKNYDVTDISKDEVDQVCNYLTEPMGRLALLCCNKAPCHSAYVRRNTIFSTQGKRIILFLTPDHLHEMCNIKERGEDPADLIVDLLEEFYLQHE
jgi:hypothetical protein